MIETTPFDVAQHLDSDEAVAVYISDALESGDGSYIAYALGVVARARGMTQISKDAGLGRESLYKALSEAGNPELVTVLRVMSALGLKLVAEPVSKAA